MCLKTTINELRLNQHFDGCLFVIPSFHRRIDSTVDLGPRVDIDMVDEMPSGSFQNSSTGIVPGDDSCLNC
jgi:hypothetical protein